MLVASFKPHLCLAGNFIVCKSYICIRPSNAITIPRNNDNFDTIGFYL